MVYALIQVAIVVSVASIAAVLILPAYYCATMRPSSPFIDADCRGGNAPAPLNDA